ncbi:MAG: MFS transporter [Proteobacteria bacterium]|nr:MFS transporter [Pseudomonadota bacterium]MDA1330878.1 MFS transporter [Pseudomonadota bacterium]
MLNDGYTKRHLWAWSMYDFANSGYTTVVITAIFNAYFVSIVAENEVWATFLWTLVLSFSYLLVVITGPVVGAYIDVTRSKKKVLFVVTLGCALSTIVLSTVGQGELWFATLFLVISNYFFSIGENIIGSYLPEIAKKESVGRVSGIGWAIGYFGGILTLALSLVTISQLESMGWEAEQYVPMTLIITGVIFLLAALPTFIYLDRDEAKKIDNLSIAFVTNRFLDTLRQGRRFVDLYRFLLSTVFFQGGVQAVIALAAIYAQQVIGFTFTETIMLIMVVNLTAALGAYIFGRLHDFLGHQQSLIVILIGWIVVTLLAWLSDSRPSFWVTANLVGLLLGACQSNARAFVSVLTPISRKAEFFGLWGISVKCASILGPLTYGALTWLTNGDHRNAILSLVVLFVIGLSILMTVDAERGMSAARHSY